MTGLDISGRATDDPTIPGPAKPTSGSKTARIEPVGDAMVRPCLVTHAQQTSLTRGKFDPLDGFFPPAR